MRTDPPAVATWLLEHAVLGKLNEALAGDLVEEFKQGRSTPWYWRQVLKAIAVGFAEGIRREWFAIGFAIAWIVGLSAMWSYIMMDPRFQFLIGIGVGWDWPQSLLYVAGVFTAATTLSLWLGLGLYVTITRRYERRRFFFGMSISLFLDMVAISVGLLVVATRRPVSIYLLSWLPLFIALLLSIFVARGEVTKPKVSQPIPTRR